MHETNLHTISEILQSQREFFSTHKTKEINFRISQLRKLKNIILQNQKRIENALWLDLHKSPEEAYLTEISIVIHEINNHLKHLRSWAKPKRVSTPIHLFPSKSRVFYEPLGISLIIAPWNYPFQLVINPLIGSISAGCCSILKPSPDAPNTSKLIEELIQKNFESKYIHVFQGGKETNTLLLNQVFDLIFFTGSSKVGKVVMKAAAENLTPVILELGGKSPCIVDKDADLKIAAKRIVWGKLINAGQTCIAPDYLFTHYSIKEKLLQEISIQIQKMYGENSKENRFYPRIVNDHAFDRLTELLKDVKIYFGGEIDKSERYISPTILDEINPDDSIMKEEIFGPILPVLTFDKLEEALEFINKKEKPLAFYYFGKSKIAKEVLRKTTSGGACINDVLIHIANKNLPFGGVGNSGMGTYHGKESFLAFSHKKSVVISKTWIDIPLKYVPFKYFEWIKKLI